MVPRHTALTELWEGAAELLQPECSYIPKYSLLKMYEVSSPEVASALERLYADRSLLALRSRQAYESVTRPEYNWSSIDQSWQKLFRSLLA